MIAIFHFCDKIFGIPCDKKREDINNHVVMEYYECPRCKTKIAIKSVRIGGRE